MNSLEMNNIEEIKKLCAQVDNEELSKIAERLNACSLIKDKIERQIVDDAPIAINRGRVVKDGVSAELDEYRRLAYSGKDYL